MEFEYWIAMKNGEYASKLDENDYPIEHTKDKSKAYKFYDFDHAMMLFNFGYGIIKEYE